MLGKYEAYNEAHSDLAVRNLLGEFQERIATVRVRVRVGPGFGIRDPASDAPVASYGRPPRTA